MRKASLAAFIIGTLMYAPAFYFTAGALGIALISHGGQNAMAADRSWWIGRTLSVLTVLLLAASIALAVFAPPLRGKRIWWAVPAAVIAIAVVYFDWLGFGFRL